MLNFLTFVYILVTTGELNGTLDWIRMPEQFSNIWGSKTPKCILPRHLLSFSFFKNPCLFQGAFIPCVFNASTFSSLKCYSKTVLWCQDNQQAPCFDWSVCSACPILLSGMTQLLPRGHGAQNVQGPAQSSSTPGLSIIVSCDVHMGQWVVSKVLDILVLWLEFKCLEIPSLPLWILGMLRI